MNNEENRHKWVRSILGDIPSDAKLIDIGAGECFYKKDCSHLEYTSQDFCQYIPNQDSQSGLHPEKWDQSQIDIVSDITHIPVEDNSFDVVLCTEVLEHVPDPVKSIKELSRILKPKGQLILTAPFCSATHYAPYHYSTGFNTFFYEKHLQELGFEIQELERNGSFFEYLAQEIHRIPSILEQYSSRRMSGLERFFIYRMLAILTKFMKEDTGSSEFLCWGYHCLAKKV